MIDTVKPDPEAVANRITPKGDKVVCLKIAAEEQTPSGLVLVGAEATVPSLARVIAIGSLCKETRVGETVLYQKYQGITYELDGCEVLLIAECFLDGALSLPAEHIA